MYRYRINNEIRYQYMGTGALGDIPRDDLLFLPFKEPLDRVTDVSPLAKHWPAIRAALAPTHFGAWYFDRGATGNLVYSRKDDSNSNRADAETQKARNEALWRLEDRMRSEGRRSTVAPDGYYPTQIGSNAQESELGGQRTFGVQEVARIYDVPATVLHDLSRGTYSNTGQTRRLFAETLELWAGRLETEINNILWPGGTRRLVLDISQAVREPFKVRMDGYETAITERRDEPKRMQGRRRAAQSADAGTDALVVQAMPQVTVQANG